MRLEGHCAPRPRGLLRALAGESIEGSEVRYLPYTPRVATPGAPCFVTAPLTIAISLGGSVTVPLERAQILAGGAMSCTGHDDRDDVDGDGRPDGWWFYLNFPATEVPWAETP